MTPPAASMRKRLLRPQPLPSRMLLVTDLFWGWLCLQRVCFCIKLARVNIKWRVVFVHMHTCT
jgi:hypothetical protein